MKFDGNYRTEEWVKTHAGSVALRCPVVVDDGQVTLHYEVFKFLMGEAGFHEESE